MNSLKMIDMFAGIGGLRLGFEKCNFQTIFANDFDKNCSITYGINFPETKFVLKDLKLLNITELPDFNFLIGGFPCQAFSIAGYQEGFLDKKGRGNLFFYIADIIKTRRPLGFLLENVKNLKTHDNGKTFKIIKDTLESIGYHIHEKVLNTMEYGNLPQNRERIYIVGFASAEISKKFKFPNKIPLTKTIHDCLESSIADKYYYTNKSLYENLKNEVINPNAIYQWRRVYVRENKNGVCPTLTANMGMGGHNVPIIIDNKGIRKLTPRECANFQGFPSNYVLPNIAESQIYKQVGNSVSVPVVARIAKSIEEALHE